MERTIVFLLQVAFSMRWFTDEYPMQMMHEVSVDSDQLTAKEVILGEHDDLWINLRHMHIAEASDHVNKTLEEFKRKNAAARLGVGKCPSATPSSLSRCTLLYKITRTSSIAGCINEENI